MIRKVLLALSLLYLAFWLSTAYILKHKISNFITQDSDAVAGRFSDITFSGFPSKWKFTVQNPIVEVKSSDGVQIFSSQSFDISFNLGMNIIKLTPNLETLVEVKTDDIPVLYKVYLRSPPKIKLKLSYPLFWPAALDCDVISVAASNIALTSEAEILSINNIALDVNFTKSSKGNVAVISAKTEYEGIEEILGFDFVQLAFDGEMEYSFDTEGDKVDNIFVHRFKVDGLDVVMDDEVAMGITGSVLFEKEKLMPDGKFDVVLQNYPEMFGASKQDIKRLIDKALGIEAQNAEFVITISDKGFMLNDVNIADFYKENIQ